MDASVAPSSETSSDNPVAAKRSKLEPSADDDEDIIEEINVRPPQVAGESSSNAGPSQLFDGEAGEDNQDSKLAEFRNKMLKYEEEASRLRTQLKREQEKAHNAEREKVKADAVREHYEAKYEEERKRANDAEAKASSEAQQKLAAAEKKEKDLQKQCDRLEMKVQSKEADVDYRDKELGNAAKDLIEAKKKAEDAEKKAAEATKNAADADQLVAEANAKAVEAETKKVAAEKDASDQKQKLESLKKSKTNEEQKLKAKITELENRLSNTGTSEQPSSSTDVQPGEALSEANKRIAQKDKENTKLQAENNKLKTDLSASKAKENARKKSLSGKDDKIESLREVIEDLRDEIKELKKLAYPETLLWARLPTANMRQAVGRFDGIADKITMKCDHGGVSLKSNPSRPTRPKVLLELKPSFFDAYDCREECLTQTDCSLLVKGFASQAGKENCCIEWQYDCAMGIQFKNAGEKVYDHALSLATNVDLEWTLIADNSDDNSYVCTFETNSFVLAQAAQKLNPVLLDFNNRGQSAAVAITDSEARLVGNQREHLWRSLPGDAPHDNDFRADFSDVVPDTLLRIYVDPKYLRRCVMASSDAGSKMVEVAMSENILRLRYGNEHFSLAYYIPTVKPADGGERCYSPIEFGHETFEL